MIITIGGKQWPVRASMRAIDECQQKEGIMLHKIDGVVDTSKMLYYCAKHGARHNQEPFKVSMAEWMDMIELKQVKYLTTVLNSLINDEGEENEDGKKKD